MSDNWFTYDQKQGSNDKPRFFVSKESREDFKQALMEEIEKLIDRTIKEQSHQLRHFNNGKIEAFYDIIELIDTVQPPKQS